MARMNKIVDLYWTESGDFVLGDNGDFKDTALDNYRGLLQRVLTRIKSQRGDWALQPTVGAGLGRFAGKPNSEATGVRIKNAISNQLLQDDLLRGGEFEIDVFPVTKYSVAIAIVITPPRSGGQVTLTLTYDARDNSIVPRNL